MHPIIPSLFLLLAGSFSGPLASCAQSGKQDTVAVRSTDSSGKRSIDELIAIGKGNQQAGIYEKVEIESEFPGGGKAWFNFLSTHLTYPQKAVRKRIEGTVVLQFIVDKDGTVSDLKALRGEPILAEAALKAMEDSPRWKPAMQNGRLVKSYKKQPIIFRLEAGK